MLLNWTCLNFWDKYGRELRCEKTYGNYGNYVFYRANEYEPYIPQKTYGHFEMENEMFKVMLWIIDFV